MEEVNRDMDTNDRHVALTVMRFVEDDVNRGTIPPLLDPSPTQTRRIGDDQNGLVSTVTASFIRNELVVSMLENIDLRELEDRWRGQNVQRYRFNTQIDESEYEQTGQYLATFTFPENLIVVRFTLEVREAYHSSETQIIWNSRFTWREIKEHLENYTYNFVFRHESLSVGLRNDMSFREDRVISTSTDQEEEAANSLRVAVDGLPEFDMICKENESENGDAVICSICHETFFNEDPAKQLPCKHLYHSKCILLWFRRKKSCPTCRYEPAIILA